jgi:hypothetical protein
MKGIASFIIVAALIFFSIGNAAANDTPNLSPTKKTAEELRPAVPAHQAAVANASANRTVNSDLKSSPQHFSLPPKSSLPVNAGQRHGSTSIGGTSAVSTRNKGIVNGTEMKRHP